MTHTATPPEQVADETSAADDPEVARVKAVLESRLLGGPPVAARIGRFVVLERVGAGAMGMVFAAFDPELDRKVAIKLLFEGEFEAGKRARLLGEAKALAKLAHPNVVGVHEVGEHNGRVFVAMEYVRGRTLTAWLRHSKRSWREILAMHEQAGRGLAAAHAQGIVHRDFKPDNVLVGDDDRARVLDFGLARLAAGDPTPRLDDSVGSSSDEAPTKLTRTGLRLGTPAYMAPEQFESAAVDEAADQFSFCVTLWEGLYGTRPFEGTTEASLVAAMRQGKPREPPRDASVPGWLRAVMQRGLAQSPSERWPSMQALLQALGRDPVATRRKWLTVSGVVGLLAVAAFSGHAWLEARPPRCSGAAEALGGAWDETQRAKVEAAMIGTDLRYATQAWQRAASELDAYAQAWTTMHEEACAATSLRGEQSPEVMDLRMSCLGRAKVQLVAVTQTLATADAEVMANAHEVTGDLRDLQRCADIDALRAKVEPPSIEDAAAVDEARRLLAQASAERGAGRYANAQQAVETAGLAVDGINYPQLRIEFLVEQGLILDALGKYQAAETAMTEAFGLATAALDADAMRRSSERLMFIVGVQLERPEEALLRLREVAEVLARTSPESEADLAATLAGTHYVRAAYDDAQRYHERALAIREEALGADHIAVAASLHGLGIVKQSRGALEEAKRLHERSLAIWENALGADHPQLALGLTSLGIVHYTAGAYAEAERVTERGLAIREKALGSDHPLLSQSLNELGNIYIALGSYEKARSVLERGLAILEKALGPDHPDVSTILFTLSGALGLQGAHDEAARVLERALAIQEKTLGPDHPDLAGTFQNLGITRAQQGKLEEGQRLLERAITLREKALGPDHSLVGDGVANLASLHELRGALADAQRLHERALAIREKALGSDHPQVAFSLWLLGNIAAQRGQTRAALEFVERAVAIYDGHDGVQQGEILARFDFAKLLWTTRVDRARAIDQARKARDADADLPPEVKRDIEAWIRQRNVKGRAR